MIMLSMAFGGRFVTMARYSSDNIVRYSSHDNVNGILGESFLMIARYRSYDDAYGILGTVL